MHVIPLQSGSSGNCIYVEAGGTKLLFDAGISGKQAQERLARQGRDVAAVDALIISHDHADHTRSMGIYQRKFGLRVYVTAKTLRAAVARSESANVWNPHHFQAGDTLRFGRVSVETIPTPHDCADGVVFIVDDGTHRLGILTDLGHVFGDLHAVISSLDAVLLESNYDPKMLSGGPYPRFLKDRIRGVGGHISNFEAAELLLAAASERLRWCCLAHLSEVNNTPELALQTHRRIFGRSKTLAQRLPLYVASRSEAIELPNLTLKRASQLIDQLPAAEEQSGKTFPCPYCKKRFGPRPKQRSHKCPSCGQTMYHICGRLLTQTQLADLNQREWLSEQKKWFKLMRDTVKYDLREEEKLRRQIHMPNFVGYLLKIGPNCHHARHLNGLLVLHEDAMANPWMLPPYEECRHDTCECTCEALLACEVPPETRVAELVGQPKAGRTPTVSPLRPVTRRSPESGCLIVLAFAIAVASSLTLF